MNSQLTEAFIGALTALVGSAVFLMPIINRYIKARLERATEEVKTEHAATLAQIQADIEHDKANTASITAFAQSTEKLAQAVANMVETHARQSDRMAGELHGNAAAITSNTETIAELRAAIDRLIMRIDADGQRSVENAAFVRQTLTDLTERLERVDAILRTINHS